MAHIQDSHKVLRLYPIPISVNWISTEIFFLTPVLGFTFVERKRRGSVDWLPHHNSHIDVIHGSNSIHSRPLEIWSGSSGTFSQLLEIKK
jgi:hypothetical protein